MTTILDGTKPLWPTWKDYARFFLEHSEEIYGKIIYDDNAQLICLAFSKLKDPAYRRIAIGTVMVATERYISDYHPEIAQIKGGYPKELND